ncbi:spore germination protein B3 precursor [Ruminiclostridium hungatei]|uniref:Spore germination protein B3 n=1 Tax=Ruminiclostridium hungatei TaxID=48256 RepID=A0A1V4SJZ5_RUMHU|nr:Ger(x)C family spore germination protein [Ruminiclostridium hungatei]OPX44222.1 spore germination protein B3 precursor [Ruminiclostridium hungatei]
MIKRVLCTILICSIPALFTTGCWNYREINQMSIVSGAAVDKTQDGKYKLTVEIIDLKSGGKDVVIHSKKLESYGDSFFDAVRNTIKFNSQKLYWGHVETIVISQKVAREGILQILDFLARDAEPRLSIDILISKEDTAAQILNSQSITTEVRAFEVNEMLDVEKALSKSVKTEVYQFINALGDEGVSAVVPVIGLKKNSGIETSQLSGTAVFKKDKLAYMFNEEDTKYYLFIINKVYGGLLVLQEKQGKNISDITLEIEKSKTEIKPVYSNGKLHFELTIRTKTNLGEVDNNAKYKNNLEFEKVANEAEKMLKKEVERVIRAVQLEYDIDIFGFGKSVKEDIPDLWKKIQPQWADIFKDVPVKVDVDVKVNHSGLLSKSIMMGD